MSNSVKTVVLWLALVVGFVALYNAFSPSRGGAGTSSSSWWVAAVAVVVVFGSFLVLVMRQRKAVKLTHEGVGLLQAGRYTEALALFEQYRAKDQHSAVGAYNIGYARLHLWQLEPAAAELKLAAGRLEQPATVELRRHALEQLALAEVLVGRLDDARAALDGRGSTLETGTCVLARAALATRAGDLSGAAALLERFEIKQLGGMYGALAAALRSFCAVTLHGAPRAIDKVALYGETGDQSLKAAWPELASVVERSPSA